MKLYSTEEAAEYLGISRSTMKYHVHVSLNIKGELVGKTLVFTQDELDAFQASRRKAGRPPKTRQPKV